MVARAASNLGYPQFCDPDYFHQRLKQPLPLLKVVEALFVPPHAQKTIPTAAGWVLIVVSIALGMAAYTNANNVLFIAVSLLLSSLVLSGILSQANFKRMRWEMELPRHFRAGEVAPVGVRLHNGKRLLPTFGVGFYSAAPDVPSEFLYMDGRLLPGRSTRLEWLYRPVRRGMARIGISGMESKYPFGFLRKIAGRNQRHEIKVWPKRVNYRMDGATARTVASNESSSRRHGSGPDLLNLRRYRPGDPMRQIHWKSSARVRRLMVRQNAEEVRPRYTLKVETAAHLWPEPGQFERLCELVGSVAEDFFGQGQLAAWAIDEAPVHPVRGLADLHALFDALATLKPQPGQSQRGTTTTDIITFHPDGRRDVYARIGGQRAIPLVA